MHITIGNRTIALARPVVMTIVNVTPDSFFAGSRTSEADAIRERIDGAIAEGTAILDIGGYSSRPGAADVTPEEELRRVGSALEIVRNAYGDFPVSIDTFRASVADAVIRQYGACLINDITGGEADPEILEVAARHRVPYLAMHMRGMPQDMQQHTRYKNITTEVLNYFNDKLRQCQAAGISQVVLDPGFGFAKTLEQNYELLAGLHSFKALGHPILAGISRKSMIYRYLNTDPAHALNGTTALHWECLRQGAEILRVHDTAEAVEVVRLFELYSRYVASQPHLK